MTQTNPQPRFLMEIFKDGKKEKQIDCTFKTVEEIVVIRREMEAMGWEWGFRRV
ncbi:MAG: hypothetical protein JXQ65_07335 [Candidatus Marinimicrobia bacterium]|nr:hypothetical protein [Candidatus Neomarinimicrobiota bacterium]